MDSTSSSASLIIPSFRCFDATNHRHYYSTLPSCSPTPRGGAGGSASIHFMGNSTTIAYPKIVTGDCGYLLDDVPHLSDYIQDLPTYSNPLQDNPAYSVVKQYFVDVDDTVAEEVKTSCYVCFSALRSDSARGPYRENVIRNWAQRAISAAHVESESIENGIGLVKLMGRHSGFIAMYATLASRDVDCCLIPESPFYLEGPGGLFEYIEKRLNENGHMVIIVAEGAGQELLSGNTCTMDNIDASGNKQLQDVGFWISQKIKDHFSKKQKLTINLKYIDPTYMICAVPSNASDNVYCTLLAHSAIHGAMAGYTGFTVGPVNGKHSCIPFQRITERQNKVVITDRMWTRCLSSTNQPSFFSPKQPFEKIGDEKHGDNHVEDLAIK
ncbi:hypothetical protein CXB51_008396 [Gossypium anomalum]|uniref:Phosphofructokinase domain-containing protein n=1 Tax=Gossypium anomalum TaxID=47600 RepID=A0A8J5Z916_9ROSI|nr:hypothetical protein CXB51_008396 [Gossypium anomalum]